MQNCNCFVLFSTGDPRVNQHLGISLYHTMFTRFHNTLADLFQKLNPGWSDEVLYQEVRKCVAALNQITVYRHVLPYLIGIIIFCSNYTYPYAHTSFHNMYTCKNLTRIESKLYRHWVRFKFYNCFVKLFPNRLNYRSYRESVWMVLSFH